MTDSAAKVEVQPWIKEAAARINLKLPNPENELGRVQAIAEIIARHAPALGWEQAIEAASRKPSDWPTMEAANANLADYAKQYFDLFEQYRNAWLREMGGVIRPKHWEIDGFVLRMRDIYEKAQLVDRMKQIMVKKLKEKCSAEELFDAVFKMLAEDRHDKIPTN